MITGYVSKAWAKKNHSQWYHDEMKKVYQDELNKPEENTDPHK